MVACFSVPEVEPQQLEQPHSGPLRFVALGDAGRGDQGQRDVAASIGEVCRREGCDLGLLLGDNLYPSGMSSPTDPAMARVFTEIYGSLPFPFYTVLGNHDYGSKSAQTAENQIQWAKNHPQFKLPSNYYSVTLGTVSLFALDTERLFWSPDPKQVEWIHSSLASSESRWKVVLGHHPYRSDGKHGNAGRYEGWSYLPFASGRALQHFFEQEVVGHADLYLAGHDHSLQSFSYNGLELIVSGAGASARPLVDRGNHPDLSASQTGFVWVELAEHLTVRLYGTGGELLGERVVRRN